MKKIICMLLALLLMAGCLFAFASCDKDDPKDDEKEEQEDDKKQDKEDEKDNEKEDEKEDEIVIPEGYVAFSDGKITFAYPKSWTKTEGSITMIQAMNGNNITVAYEPKSDMYEKMTIDSYNATYKPIYESMGMVISNVKIEKKETNGQKVVVIRQDNVTNGVSMTQTQYIMAVGDRNYVVTVTEVADDASLVETVFQTLKPVK